jgi:hypothetical protein
VRGGADGEAQPAPVAVLGPERGQDLPVDDRDGAGNDSFLMRLGPDAEGMRADLSQKWRYNLKLAERNPLSRSSAASTSW